MAEHKTCREVIQRLSAAPNAKTQRARIHRLQIDAHGGWVSLPEIMACAAQYNARVLELRRLGFVIENKRQRDDSGVVYSWYRLVSGVPKVEIPKSEPAKPAPELTGLPLFDAVVRP